MTRRTLTALIVLAVVGATVATVARATIGGPAFVSAGQEEVQPGPDSARVAKLLDALTATDPLVCELIADQLGNFWWDGDSYAVGRFADALAPLTAARDSLHGRVRAGGAIALLTARLRDDAACPRRVAAKLLGRSTLPTSRLIALLGDGSARVQEAAAYAIGTDERYEALAALEGKLSAAEPISAMAAWALAEMHDSVPTPVFVRALRSEHPRVRIAALHGLGDSERDDAREPVERALRDSHAGVRAYAARALGDIGSARSAPALATALADTDRDVRLAAAHAFGDLNEFEKAPDALVRAAESSDLQLSVTAVHALAEIADPATIDVLIGRITSPSREVRLQVIDALSSMRLPKAVPALMRALKDADPEVRRAAAEALGEMKEGID